MFYLVDVDSYKTLLILLKLGGRLTFVVWGLSDQASLGSLCDFCNSGVSYHRRADGEVHPGCIKNHDLGEILCLVDL